MWHVYFRSGQFILPVVAKTEAGFFLDVEPVRGVLLDDTAGLEKALGDVIGQGNPVRPTPCRASFPKPVVLPLAKVKTWATFEKKSVCWTVTREHERYVVAVTGRAPDGGWTDDPSGTIMVGPAAGVTGVVTAIREHLAVRKDL
jgi:hypothetical protein